MTNMDFIKLKAFDLPENKYFLEVLNKLEEKYKKDKKNKLFLKEDEDETVRWSVINNYLDKLYPQRFRISFSDNDFCQNIFYACKEFVEQFHNSKRNGPALFQLYQHLDEKNITIEDFLKSYILQKSYGDYIGGLYRHLEVDKKPIYEDKEIFDYFEEMLEVKVVDYWPDEIAPLHMSQYPWVDYEYKDDFWNSEDCFIDMERRKTKIL